MNAAELPKNIELQRFSEWIDRNDNFPTPYSDKTKRVYLSVVTGLITFSAKEDIRVVRRVQYGLDDLAATVHFQKSGNR